MAIDRRVSIGRPAALGPWWKRLAWFIGLWAAGVLAVASLAYAIRFWLD